METKSTKKTPKNAQIFTCVDCDFTCSKQSDYNRHEATRKHLRVNKMSTISTACDAPEINSMDNFIYII